MPNTNEVVTVSFVIPEGQVDQVLTEVIADGGNAKGSAESYNPPPELADMFGDQQFEPLMIIAVTLSAGFLIKRIADIYSDLSHPKGLLVDARVTPARMIETKSLNRGEVVILHNDRTDSFAPEERDAALEALKSIFGAKSE